MIQCYLQQESSKDHFAVKKEVPMIASSSSLHENLRICSLDEIVEKTDHNAKYIAQIYGEVSEIFWETSSRNDFGSESAKKDFKNKYLGYYFERYPELFFVALSEKTNPNNAPSLLGYICGSPDTVEDELLFKASPYLEKFKDKMIEFPAHLHINTRSTSRGLGLGTKLLAAFEKQLISTNSPGVHLITESKARNVSFYKKNGYVPIKEEKLSHSHLLLMAKSLRSCPSSSNHVL